VVGSLLVDLRLTGIPHDVGGEDGRQPAFGVPIDCSLPVLRQFSEQNWLETASRHELSLGQSIEAQEKRLRRVAP
jgi:hypothetical protein